MMIFNLDILNDVFNLLAENTKRPWTPKEIDACIFLWSPFKGCCPHWSSLKDHYLSIDENGIRSYVDCTCIGEVVVRVETKLLNHLYKINRQDAEHAVWILTKFQNPSFYSDPKFMELLYACDASDGSLECKKLLQHLSGTRLKPDGTLRSLPVESLAVKNDKWWWVSITDTMKK